MLLTTARLPVARIDTHYIYTIINTHIISIASPQQRATANETRYLMILNGLNLTKGFYFSYTYDLAKSLQENHGYIRLPSRENRFQWNFELLKDSIESTSPWYIGIIHGFVDQIKIDLFGRQIQVCLIARRSRHFAGARFLKRGVNLRGQVANDVETEQIVGMCRELTSYVQYRGSIPLHWSQDTSNLAPKPKISLDLSDPFFTSAAIHFDDMIASYGTPIIALNLIKQRERLEREGVLLDEFSDAIAYLNQTLPSEDQIRYIAFDMSKATKSPFHDVLGILNEIAAEAIGKTKFYHVKAEPYMNNVRRQLRNLTHRTKEEAWRQVPLLQQGTIRINCIDCLDRTNAAMYMVGKRVFTEQLTALGILSNDHPELPFDCHALEALMALYQNHGDAIALQYGGSLLVNTMETYRKVNQWAAQGRDALEAFKRWHSNSFMDADKQNAINLFLRNYRPAPSRPQLWELPNDFWLHNPHPSEIAMQSVRNYTQWRRKGSELRADQSRSEDLQYDEFYQPQLLTSFGSYQFPSANSNIEEESPFIAPEKQITEAASTGGDRAKIISVSYEGEVGAALVLRTIPGQDIEALWRNTIFAKPQPKAQAVAKKPYPPFLISDNLDNSVRCDAESATLYEAWCNLSTQLSKAPESHYEEVGSFYETWLQPQCSEVGHTSRRSVASIRQSITSALEVSDTASIGTQDCAAYYEHWLNTAATAQQELVI